MTIRSIAAVAAAGLLACAAAPPASAQWLGFDPGETVPDAKVFTVDLRLDTQDVTIMGVDVLFSFLPSIVRLDSVTVGDWFTTAPQPHFFWCDPALAEPNLARVTGSVVTTGRAGAGALAVLHFTALEAGFCPLVFQSTVLRDPLNAGVPHTASTGDRIVIEEAIPAAGVSLGGLKSRWR